MADTKNTLYIGRIPKDMSEREVKMSLEDVSGCTVKSFEFDGTNSTAGWAFFKDHETTIKAIKLIQKSVYTASLTKKSSSTAASVLPTTYTDNQSTKVLFARGIKSQDEGQVLQDQLGTTYVEKVVVPLDMQKRVPLGHAFIYCHTVEDAKTLMERNEGGVEFLGRSISLAWGLPKQKHRGFVDPYATGAYDYSYMLYPDYLSQMYPPPPPPPHYAGSTGGRAGRYDSHYSGSSGKHSGGGGGRHHDHHHHHPAPHYPYPMVHPSVKGGYEAPYPPPAAFYPPVERSSRGGRGAPSGGYSRYTPY
ncbi:RNA-binding region RNP-1 domain-containing protein [Cavenderia fasciculata]|uniref:RNA-binding region RNP-1 domain-containing protein n=1 Tax=Cavenderia fasciculata TaxID=261658 RepID=F4PKS3_CACFS|nr:RNA-binding region RNP-1 domain-containing protein [Cavenderia fasciculata]EGG24197.1 RNA-binding region RNP-1 domain-containing protein [Cavenderia fasciculata]|eukprot:XP_004362048.1 RNA-binding region RNP-1 domain-containing protein [Cavenderia fasciculata]